MGFTGNREGKPESSEEGLGIEKEREPGADMRVGDTWCADVLERGRGLILCCSGEAGVERELWAGGRGHFGLG